MKRIVRILVFSCTAMICAWATQVASWAQSAVEPTIIISISSLNNQLDDISYLTEAAGFAGAGNMARVQLEGFTTGIDKNKPMCVHLFLKEGQAEPEAVIFIPVTNFDDVLNTVSGMASVEDEDDHSVISTPGGPSMYAKEIRNHAVITQSTDAFELGNVDLAAGLGDLPSRFNLSARIYAQRIPAEMREQMLEMIESSYREQLEQLAEDDFAAELQAKNFELQMAQLRSLVNETDQIVLGLDFDKAGKNVHLDVEMIGLDGSTLANRVAKMKPSSASRFAGFLLDGTAFNANTNFNLTAEDIEQYKSSISDVVKAAKQKIEEESNLSEGESTLINGLVDEFFGLITKTVENGSVDAGAAMTMADKKANLAIGLATASPDELESKIKALVAEVQPKLENDVKVRLDCENYQGVRFHEITVDVPEGEDELSNLFGTQVKIYVGFGEDVVYLAAGSDPMELLKRAINPSSKIETGDLTMQYNLFLAPILKTVGAIQGEQQVEEMGNLLSTTGRDRVQMSSKTIANGIHFRLEVQDGILKMLGAMGGPMLGMGQPGMDF